MKMLMSVAALAGTIALASDAEAATYTNSLNITVPGSDTDGPADPFPSTIDVTESGLIIGLTVDIFGLSHTYPDDVFLGLASPDGTTVILMNDALGENGIVNVDLTFDDAASSAIPNTGTIVSGTYSTGSYGPLPGNLPADIPTFTAGGDLSDFVGLEANGTWSLFVLDDHIFDTGSISGGWALNIEVAPVPLPAGILLLLAGLGSLGLLSRRRRS
ncbi:VPLPA-CTERM sorting domain-containing protein [Tateyamaria sp. Alg231-49]|uniref:VPLPA-CTERM sorting domain-containing protein n=1 Tax=Tateyamaria sp. Alg231-49 TaxID=1922219 RepID=UPI000D55A095|nr:VPLPA-CTERM sorting domain-containing protein [Tateyamaria sp. Alg231-49]